MASCLVARALHSKLSTRSVMLNSRLRRKFKHILVSSHPSNVGSRQPCSMQTRCFRIVRHMMPTNYHPIRRCSSTEPPILLSKLLCCWSDYYHSKEARVSPESRVRQEKDQLLCKVSRRDTIFDMETQTRDWAIGLFATLQEWYAWSLSHWSKVIPLLKRNQNYRRNTTQGHCSVHHKAL